MVDSTGAISVEYAFTLLIAVTLLLGVLNLFLGMSVDILIESGRVAKPWP